MVSLPEAPPRARWPHDLPPSPHPLAPQGLDKAVEDTKYRMSRYAVTVRVALELADKHVA